ncbi:MAG: DUF1987 domain-containing protein [Candidatus Electrothrix aestuarii]|uniref:DUF1987 domain-containing protein n=1 Tax=Candidatus Electrothrix aestuarii TaxID=3062594 RepID=A0AAU8LS40_9BACT|nr:DUF1987 domain-containing protein [Candidatus Electrothrix aestuarii]
MDHLQIEATDDTLKVDFYAETGVLALEGESYPENPSDFFAPLLDWIKQYIQEVKGPLTLNTTISYLNTSSSKCMLDLLETLDKYYESGGRVAINWYYEEDNEDMEETGEELCEDLEIPYKVLPI